MRESVRRRLVTFGLVVIAVGILSACVVGSDEPAPTNTVEPVPSSTTASVPTATRASTATPALPTETPVPPTPTQSPTPTPTPTATPIPKEPLGTVNQLDPAAVTNYSLATEIEVRGVPGQSDFVMSLLILQSAHDHYYLRSITGDSGIESWLVDGTTYLTQADGSVARLPEGTDTALFSPALLIQTIPTISGETLGTPLGTEDIDGRQASRYVIDAADVMETANWLPGDTADEVEGQVEVWIDVELRIIVRQESDVRWVNEDRSKGSYVNHYEITHLFTTVPVTAPG